MIEEGSFEDERDDSGKTAERKCQVMRPAVKIQAVWIRNCILAGSYTYLALPVLIFFLGWCRWYIGIPCALILVISVVFCMREWHRKADTEPVQTGISYILTYVHMRKLAMIIIVILLWTGLSGVGGYVWQNQDHSVRNELFVLLAEGKWPLAKELETASGSEIRGLVYYVGYWLPAALAGKLFGLKAGWAMQYLWAAAGIGLMYACICVWRKKLTVWPLWILIFFSGLDAAGVLLGCREKLHIFGDVHLEAWAPYYQFSSMTTQLFWVFNQAIPAWLLASLVFLGEKPRNMGFLASQAILTSTFPFVGVLPYVLYFMITRSSWNRDCRKISSLLKDCWKNWGSLQNMAGSAVTVLVCGIYIAGNNAVRNSMPFLSSGRRMFLLAAGGVLAAGILWLVTVLVLRGWGRQVFFAAAVLGVSVVMLRFARLPYADWQSPLFYWMNHTLFYMAEAGGFLAVLYPMVKDRKLFALNAVWLYLIPLILVGRSCDFCMRASIPGLFLILLWCIYAIDTGIRKSGAGQMRVYLLILLLVVGAVTPLHEMKRTFVNTREYYENQTAVEEDVFMGNNFSGSVKGFFWRHLAKPYQVRQRI